jgi:hypothetical protein
VPVIIDREYTKLKKKRMAIKMIQMKEMMCVTQKQGALMNLKTLDLFDLIYAIMAIR